MNVLGDECLRWWMSDFSSGVMNVLGDECLRWWTSRWWMSDNRWSWLLSLHCNQRLVLLFKFIHTSIIRFLFKHYQNDPLKNTKKVNFAIRKWKWWNWTLSLLSSMWEFLVRPSTGGICCTRQNLPPCTPYRPRMFHSDILHKSRSSC